MKTIWGNPKEMSKVTSDKFDVVVENNGKKLDDVMPVADWAKVLLLRSHNACSEAWYRASWTSSPHP